MYENLHDIENIFETSLMLAPAYEFKKSFSNNQLMPTKIMEGNLNQINQSNQSNTITDSNLNECEEVDEVMNVNNGVIFSKISRLTDKSKQITEFIDNYKTRHEEASKVMQRDIHTKDRGKAQSKKKKRNILRDPDDKRTITKNNSTVHKNGFRRRNDGKQSLDSRINGQNVLQVSKKISGYYMKDEAGNIVVMSDHKNRINDRSAVAPSEVHKTKSNLFGSKERVSSKNANQSDLYNNFDKPNQYTGPENKPFGKNKTSRPVKTRKFKKNRTNRELDSVRDPKLELDKRNNSTSSKDADLVRQKTFDSKSQNNKFVGKRSIVTVDNNPDEVQTEVDDFLPKASQSSMSNVSLLKESNLFRKNKSPSKHSRRILPVRNFEI